MSVSIAEFWKLLAASRLSSREEVQQFAAQFDKEHGGQTPTAKSAADWLLARKVISRYQAATLLAGRAGPFLFGDYRIQERIVSGPSAKCFRSIHIPTGQQVLLQALTGEALSDPVRWEAAVNQYWLSSDIASPHVQRCFDLVDLPKIKILVMEDLGAKPLVPAFEQFAAERREQLAASRAKPPPAPAVEAVARVLPLKPSPTKTPPTAVPAVDFKLKVPDKKKASGITAAEILRKRAKRQRMQMITGLAVVLLVAAGAAVSAKWWWPALNGAVVAAPSVEKAGQAAANAPPVAAVAAQGNGESAKAVVAKEGNQQVIADDGNTLWAAPTNGKPVSFRCVPPEGQVFLIVRPAALLESDEGQRLIQALGPNFAAQRLAWEEASGFKLGEIEQLILTLHNNDAKFPRASFVVRTKDSFTPEQALTRWGGPAEAKEKSQTYYTRGSWSYFVSKSPEDERTFAMGEERDIKEVAAAAGSPPVLFREIERLRRATDAERHFTLLFYPQFLFNDDGEPLFAGQFAKARGPLGWLLDDQLQAASVSLHCGEEFYSELRLLGALDKEPHRLAQELRTRVNQIPQEIEAYIDRAAAPPYWSRLARRYPLMVGQLHQHLRFAVEQDQVIVNGVLPGPAGHNLVLGGELLVSTTPGAIAPVAAAAQTSSSPKTIEEALLTRSTYSFDQQSLEFAMRDLAEEVQGNLKGASFEFAIKILGDDLKIDGITRNQSIRDFKQENQPVADILTALVRKANPVTTVKDPSEPDQKLVWVVGPDPDSPGREIILITTRTAATAKKYKLPAPFVVKKT